MKTKDKFLKGEITGVSVLPRIGQTYETEKREGMKIEDEYGMGGVYPHYAKVIEIGEKNALMEVTSTD